MASRWSTAERTPPTWRWMERTKQKYSRWWFGGINKDVWCVRQMCASIVPVGADKHDLKLLTRFFDGSIWFHQDPCQTATRRALIKKESKREEEWDVNEWTDTGTNMMVAEEVSIALGISKLSLSPLRHQTLLLLRQTASFKYSPDLQILTTNPAVILHLGRVCAALWLCVCVWRAPALSRQGERWYGWH